MSSSREKHYLSIQGVYDLSDLLESVDRRTIRPVGLGLLEDEQAPTALVEHAVEDLVKYHLRKPAQRVSSRLLEGIQIKIAYLSSTA
ncbi:hypothetical protein ACG7TL_003264 [Trametes sanguinea]